MVNIPSDSNSPQVPKAAGFDLYQFFRIHKRTLSSLIPISSPNIRAGVLSMVTATGDVVVAGLGFRPQVILFHAQMFQNASHSNHGCNGYYNDFNDSQGCVFWSTLSTGTGAGQEDLSNAVHLGSNSVTIAKASVTALDNDSFTLNVSDVTGLSGAGMFVHYVAFG